MPPQLKIKRLVVVTTLLCMAIMAACSPAQHDTEALSPKPADASAPTRQVDTAAPDAADWCPEGNDAGRRLNDLAEHVHDTAVAEYLRKNVFDAGRKSTPHDRLYALMLLNDHTSYETCVTAPERCLRAELLRTENNAERDALLTSKGVYAYERAMTCLQRAGDAYASREPAPDLRTIDPADLDTAYRERIIPALIGNMMPVDACQSSR